MAVIIEVSNQSEEAFSQVLVRLSSSESFEFLSSSPEQEDEDRDEISWILDQILPGERKQISFSGLLSETLSGEVLLRIEQFLSDNEGELLSAGRSFVFTKVLSSPLVLTQSITPAGSFSSKAVYITSGQDLDIKVNYDHQGITGLKNVVISLVFDEDVFDFSRMRNSKGVGQRSGNVIKWIPGANPELRVVSPGQSGSFQFRLPVSKNLSSNPSIKSRIEFAADEFKDSISGDSLDLKIQTELQLAISQSVISQSQDQITYRVVLIVSNTVNDSVGSLLSTVLPGLDSRVNFDSVSPVSEKSNFVVEGSSGVIKWQLGTVSAFSTRQVSFDLTTSAVILLSDIILVGTDMFTGNEITVSAGDLRAK